MGGDRINRGDGEAAEGAREGERRSDGGRGLVIEIWERVVQERIPIVVR